MIDEKYMHLALELAKKGSGYVNPNPMVGAVIVKDDRIIGQGYHARYKDLHAERAALLSCTESPRGAEMYVTLEPCCHYGNQPPCTEAIIQAGIKHVIIGSADPNPLVAGKGIEILRKNGILVTENFLRKECDDLNKVFLHFISKGIPYVVMKYAMTMDGKIATYAGASKWITGEAARRRVHEDRSRYAAIMVGIGTVLKDDPLLTCRISGGKNPIRIICDTHLKTPLKSQIVESADECRTIIATSTKDKEICQSLIQAGCEIIYINKKDGHIDLKELMKKLGQMKIDSILLEGGSTLNWSALQEHIVNKVQAYIAPKLFGGKEAPSPIGGIGTDIPGNAVRLSPPVLTVLDNDILMESEVI